jgi:hypothetical protein
MNSGVKTMRKLLLASASALALACVGTSAHALGVTDVIQAPTGYFVPTDAQKYDYPYYRGYGADWGWTHNAINSLTINSASLNISAFDVDSCCGEVDQIFAKDSGAWVLLGSLTGVSDAWAYGNTFVLGSNFYDDIASGLEVRMHIDAYDQGWIVTLGKSALEVNGGLIPPPTPGAPEPATWAMMLMGFLGLGALARRKAASFKAA